MSAIAQIHLGVDGLQDAEKFINVAGITDATQKAAIRQLVFDLKSYGIWLLLKAFYPFVGGTATTHSYNLVNPSGPAITWVGTWTHNSNGVTGDGAAARGDTGFDGNGQGLNNNSHMSAYSRTNTDPSGAAIGAYNLSNAFWAVIPRSSNSFNVGSYRFTADGWMQSSNSDSRGLFMENRVSSSSASSWKNGVSQQTATTTSQSIPNTDIKIAAYSAGAGFSALNLASASIGLGMTSTQAADFYTAVQAFQTTLGRQV